MVDRLIGLSVAFGLLLQFLRESLVRSQSRVMPTAVMRIISWSSVGRRWKGWKSGWMGTVSLSQGGGPRALERTPKKWSAVPVTQLTFRPGKRAAKCEK